MDKIRSRRPYEKKVVKKGSALVFGLGLGALLATIALLFGLVMPGFSTRFDNLSYRARTIYRKLMPHPQYLPTPLPTVAAVAITTPEAASPTPPLPPPTATLTASPPHSLTAPSSPTPVVTLQPTGQKVQLSGLAHQWQTWNNCGPATITMDMSYFGRPETQVEAAKFLKPNRDDKNVNPAELAAYARTTGLEAIVRHSGSIDLLKRLLSNNLPVVAETWLIHDEDGMGHYRLLTGYDDTTGQFNTFDSLNGPNFKVAYTQFDSDWRVFNRVYLVIYPSEQADTVAAIIGADMDDRTLYERLQSKAMAETEARPDDAIAYFNLGDALTRLGRFPEAVTAFDRARQLGLHWRRLWYQFSPFEAYYATGRYQDVLTLADATIKNAGGLEEAYYYRGLALQAINQIGAEESFQAALDYNPNFALASEALKSLSAKSQ